MKSKRVREGKFRHTQHTEKFIREVNSPTQNIQQPFRISDERWTIGKFKGIKIDETPTHYLQWVLDNFKHLAKSHQSILEKKLN